MREFVALGLVPGGELFLQVKVHRWKPIGGGHWIDKGAEDV